MLWRSVMEKILSHKHSLQIFCSRHHICWPHSQLNIWRLIHFSHISLRTDKWHHFCLIVISFLNNLTKYWISRYRFFLMSKNVVIKVLWMVVLIVGVIVLVAEHVYVVSAVIVLIPKEFAFLLSKIEISIEFLVIFIAIVLVHPIWISGLNLISHDIYK
jgi:hypothetical protein